MLASQSSRQSFSRSSVSFFCADATKTSVSVVRTFFDFANNFASIMEKIRSMPMLIPTQGTLRSLASNIPTRLSYRPPPAMLPTETASPSEPLGCSASSELRTKQVNFYEMMSFNSLLWTKLHRLVHYNDSVSNNPCICAHGSIVWLTGAGLGALLSTQSWRNTFIK